MPANHEQPRVVLQPLADGEPLGECCAGCRFWQREAGQDQAGRRVAPCRRFPPSAVLATTLQRQIQPNGQIGMVPVQHPATLPTVTAAADWCGEFFLETRAAHLRGN